MPDIDTWDAETRAAKGDAPWLVHAYRGRLPIYVEDVRRAHAHIEAHPACRARDVAAGVPWTVSGAGVHLDNYKARAASRALAILQRAGFAVWSTCPMAVCGVYHLQRGWYARAAYTAAMAAYKAEVRVCSAMTLRAAVQQEPVHD